MAFNDDEFKARVGASYLKLKEARKPIPQERIVAVINERQAEQRTRREQLEAVMEEVAAAYVDAPPGKQWNAFLDMVVKKSPVIIGLGGSSELQSIVATCATIHGKLATPQPTRADRIRTDEDAQDNNARMMRLREMLNRPAAKEDLS